MDVTNMADSEWRSSTRRFHMPGGSSSMSSLLGFGYANDKVDSKDEKCDGNNANNGNSKQGSDQTGSRPQSAGNVVNDGNVLGRDVNGGPKSTESKDSSESDASKVREFTSEAGQYTPDRPQWPMDCDEVKFIGKMILDEMLELFSTVMQPEAAKTQLKCMIDNAKSLPKMRASPNDQHKLIAEQADAFVDIWYYSLNAACKKGINCSKIFNIVHNANMAKRDAETGKFLKREDGKIIKPKGWKPPSVEKEILRQMQKGAWTQDE